MVAPFPCTPTVSNGGCVSVLSNIGRAIGKAATDVGNAIKRNAGAVAKVAAVGALALPGAGPLVAGAIAKVGSIVSSVSKSSGQGASVSMGAAGQLANVAAAAEAETPVSSGVPVVRVGGVQVPSWVAPAALVGLGVFFFAPRRRRGW